MPISQIGLKTIHFADHNIKNIFKSVFFFQIKNSSIVGQKKIYLQKYLNLSNKERKIASFSNTLQIIK